MRNLRRRNSSILSDRGLNGRLRRIKEQIWLTSSSSTSPEPEDQVQIPLQSDSVYFYETPVIQVVVADHPTKHLANEDLSDNFKHFHISGESGSITAGATAHELEQISNRAPADCVQREQECSVQPSAQVFPKATKCIDAVQPRSESFKAWPTRNLQENTFQHQTGRQKNIGIPRAGPTAAQLCMPPTLVNSRMNSNCISEVGKPLSEPRKRVSLQNDGHVALEIQKMEAIAQNLGHFRIEHRRPAESNIMEQLAASGNVGSKQTPDSMDPSRSEGLNSLHVTSSANLLYSPAAAAWRSGRSLLYWRLWAGEVNAGWRRLIRIVRRHGIIRRHLVIVQTYGTMASKGRICRKRCRPAEAPVIVAPSIRSSDSLRSQVCHILTKWYCRQDVVGRHALLRAMLTEWTAAARAAAAFGGARALVFRRKTEQRQRALCRDVIVSWLYLTGSRRREARAIFSRTCCRQRRLLQCIMAWWIHLIHDRARLSAMLHLGRTVTGLWRMDTATGMLIHWNRYARACSSRAWRGRRFVLLRVSRLAARTVRAWRQDTVRRSALSFAAWRFLSRLRKRKLTNIWVAWREFNLEALGAEADETLDVLTESVNIGFRFQLFQEMLEFIRTNVVDGQARVDGFSASQRAVKASYLLSGISDADEGIRRFMSIFVAISARMLMRKSLELWVGFGHRAQWMQSFGCWLQGRAQNYISRSLGPYLCFVQWAACARRAHALRAWLRRTPDRTTLRPALVAWRHTLVTVRRLEALNGRVGRCFDSRSRLYGALRALASHAIRRVEARTAARMALQRLGRRRAFRAFVRWRRVGPTVRALAAAVGIGQASSRWRLDATLLQCRASAEARQPPSRPSFGLITPSRKASQGSIISKGCVKYEEALL